MLEQTHHGKIARLPRNLRHELNQRLADGEPSDSLLAWLNALPEVQAILADRFGGNPISPQVLRCFRWHSSFVTMNHLGRGEAAEELGLKSVG